MATKILPNKIYHCKSETLGSASFQVISGTAKIYASNVTEYTTDGANKLIVPTADKFVATGDEMEAGLHLIAGLPEFLYIESASNDPIWCKMGIDTRIEPVDAE